MAHNDLILVTGANGFIAGHCIKAALARGYRVRCTMRRSRSEALVRAAVGEPGDRLTFVHADLNADEGWDAAVAGCRLVLHAASPVPLWAPRDPGKTVRPARDGALRVLRAAAAARVERTVLTSSNAAVVNDGRNDPDHVYTEADWSDVTGPIGTYALSKTLAERAAWDFIASDSSGMTLAVVNPTAVLGPVLHRDDGASGGVLVRRLLGGLIPALPKLAFNIVDVRDVAEGHLAAAELPGAAGERFLLTSEAVWVSEVAQFLAAAIPARARRLPRREIPTALVRAFGPLIPPMRPLLGNLGVKRLISGDKARTMLGISFRRAEEATAAMGLSLMEFGAV